MRQQVEEQPAPRRLVGIDLGIASKHSVRVLEADGQMVCRASCVPTVASLSAVERAALAGAPEGTRLAVVFEPTGPAWLPVAVFFARRGHAVFRVSSAKAADLRRFLRRHAKSNGIDAETLARMPLADPGGLQQLELPGPQAAALDRRVRACERLTRAGSEHKVRITWSGTSGSYPCSLHRPLPAGSVGTQSSQISGEVADRSQGLRVAFA